MKLALAQINTLVGDVTGNAEKLIDWIGRARAAGADVVLFPELALCGYPPKDLLYKPVFIDACAAELQRVASASVGITSIVGWPERNPKANGRALFNSAAICRNGRIEDVHRKRLLPTYDVFDESRYFESAAEHEAEVVRDAGGHRVLAGITICEDLWNEESVIARPLYAVNPIERLAKTGAKLILNISASPFEAGKQDTRTRLFGAAAKRHGVTIAYVNQVGGNDDLVFDGGSAVFDSHGIVVAQAKAFEEDLLVVDIADLASARVERFPERIEAIYEALVLGTRDYVTKCRFKSVVLGLSGGIDSALTAAIAVDALGAASVHGVAMPSRYSSEHSLFDARDLATNLGIDLVTVPIDPMHRAFESSLAPVFAGRAPDVAEENIQARIRGNLLMAMSNKFGWLLLTTGNKSELAVGYCTLYGDMCGGLAVISDVPKTTVYELSRYVNARAGRVIIPEGTLTKPPSAELRPNQTDQDSLPPYDVLDAILKMYVEENASADQIVAAGFGAAVVRDVIRRVDMNEYKRKQMAPGLKVTSRAFGTGRRMPIAAKHG